MAILVSIQAYVYGIMKIWDIFCGHARTNESGEDEKEKFGEDLDQCFGRSKKMKTQFDL